METKLDYFGDTMWEKRYIKTLNDLKKNKFVSPLRIIRLSCMECMGFQEQEVRLCDSEECILHKFRMGRNPKKREYSQKQLEAHKRVGERLKFTNSSLRGSAGQTKKQAG